LAGTDSLFARYRHAQLLVAVALLLLVDPFLSGYVGTRILDAFLIVTLISAIVACASSRRHIVIGVSLAVCVMVALFLRERGKIESADLALSLLAICFFAYVIALVLGSVFRDERQVSLNTICGGLSVYLLLGLLWAFVFAVLESAVPHSFEGIDHTGGTGYRRFFAFSFVTLTTLGYGNVVPLTARAEALAFSEAIVGQLYLTVLVARLVALNLLHGSDRVEP